MRGIITDGLVLVPQSGGWSAVALPLPVSWPEIQEQLETELSLPKADSCASREQFSLSEVKTWLKRTP
jgi:hypothetical protein